MTNNGFTLRDETAVELIEGRYRIVDYRYIYLPDGRRGGCVRRMIRPGTVAPPRRAQTGGVFIVGVSRGPCGRREFVVVSF